MKPLFFEDRARLAWGIAFGAVGFALAGAFTFGTPLPTPIALGALYALCLWGLWHVRTTRGAWLSRLMIVIYTAPFTQIWPLLFRDRAIWWIPFSSQFTDIMLDRDVSRSMVNVGVIGLVALLGGLYLAAAYRIRLSFRISQSPGSTRHFRLWAFWVLLAGAFLFSWWDASSETLLSAKTITPEGLAHKNNMNSAYLLSYILLILLWVDTEEIGKPSTKHVRRLVLYLSMLFIVFYFQLLRGNRESIGLVFGLAGLYLTEPDFLVKGLRKDKILRWSLCGITMMLLMVMFLWIQRYREYCVRRNTNNFVNMEYRCREQTLLDNLEKQWNTPENQPEGQISNPSDLEAIRFYMRYRRLHPAQTWGACLLTNLSMANQYEKGTLPMEWGRTYWQYVLSLPPGILTRRLGIERPMERDHNPAWWFKDISAGGSHIVTVAFVNFRAWGVAILLLIYGYFIGWTDQCSRGRWIGRLWYGAFYLVCFQWFWYGDMFFIRGAMAYGLVLGCYAIARRSHWITRLSDIPENEIPLKNSDKK